MLQTLVVADTEPFADLFYEVGTTYWEMKRHDKALTYLRRVVEFEQYNTPVVWQKMAACLLALGNLEPAEHLVTAALDMEPSFTEAKQVLLAIYEKQGKHVEALKISILPTQFSIKTKP